MKKINFKKVITVGMAAVMCMSFLGACGAQKAADETVTETETTSDESGVSEETSNFGFGMSADSGVKLEDVEVQHNTNFGGMNIMISIDEFNSNGFQYGDSVKITLSNGKVYEDIPYYDGYHTRTGELVLCAYPGYTSIHFTRNNSGDIWDEDDETALLKSAADEENDFWFELGLSADEKLTATFEVTEAGKYLEAEQAMSLVYSDDRTKYDSDVIFANFREITCADIAADTLYRSASPCNNEHNRASYVDTLAQEAGINFILNLADNEDEVAGYMEMEDFNSPYFESLLDRGQVSLIDLTAAYRTDVYIQKVVEGFTAMSETDPPYLFHCTEGKDRTGFIAILLECLCGADYDEMKDDYMITYSNYYKVDEDSEPEKYAAIVDIKFNDMVFYLETLEYGEGTEKTEDVDFEACARDYLHHGGMEDEQIDKLIFKLTHDRN